MKLLRKKRHPLEAVSVTNDIAFLLVVYFLAIAGFNINQGFLMNLPGLDPAQASPRPEPLRFEMDGESRLFYKGERMDVPEVEWIIGEAKKDRPNLGLELQVSSRCPWQGVVSFVEMAQKLKVDAFSFKMRGEENASP